MPPVDLFCVASSRHTQKRKRKGAFISKKMVVSQQKTFGQSRRDDELVS